MKNHDQTSFTSARAAFIKAWEALKQKEKERSKTAMQQMKKRKAFKKRFCTCIESLADEQKKIKKLPAIKKAKDIRRTA